jgi:hypothetical protein
MTTVIASPQHQPPAGTACFRRRTAVVPALPNADRMLPGMAKSPRRRQRRRKILNRDRRSAVECAGQRYPRRGRCPIKSP